MKIFGPTCENGVWRIETNLELEEKLYCEFGLVKAIHDMRLLRWYHTEDIRRKNCKENLREELL